MPGWVSALRHRFDAVVEVVRERDLRRLQIGWTAFFLVDAMSMVALSVWAFDRLGAKGVGYLGVARLLPGALALPFGAWAADRFSRRAVVSVVFAAISLSQAAIAMVVATRAPAIAVYLLVATASVAATPYRSAQLALAPLVARTPGELVAMNVTAGALEGLATFVGPALAALLILTTGPSLVLVVAAVAAAAGFVAVVGIRVEVDPSKAVRRSRDRPLHALLGGFIELHNNPDAAVVVGCFIAQLIVRGFLTVLLVSVSFDLLGLGDSGVGWLAAAIGIGGIVGGVYAVGLTGRRRLARPFAVALTLWGLPIAVIGFVPRTAVVLVALSTIGVGNAILDVSGFTLIQRLGADRSLGRVFGVLFTVGIGLGGLAALAAPVLVSSLGLRPVLVLVGAFLPFLALALVPRFMTIDQHSEPLPELLTLFSGIPLFAPLPATTVEKIAVRCSVADMPAGCVIIREGDNCDRFYAIVQGEVAVRTPAGELFELGCGDHFGEIALLRDICRTATVTAQSDVRLASLGATEFLDALASSDQAYGIAWRTSTAMIDSNVRGQVRSETLGD